jgi:hypothetical protein
MVNRFRSRASGPSRSKLIKSVTAAVLLLAALALGPGAPGCGDDDGEADPDAGASDAGGADAGGADAGLGDAAVDGALPDGGHDPDGGADPDAGWYAPGPDTTWQWQLTGTLNTGYAVGLYDIDLFDTPAATIAALQAQGRAVICYFSAGSAEDWRDDYDQFQPTDLGNELDGWPGEYWLDVRSASVRAVMQSRLDLAAQKGCDGVEPDNVDGYTNDPGFSFTATDQLDYNLWLADQAHARSLAVGLKNDLGQIPALVDRFDFAVNEECHDYSECHLLQPFLDAGKPVFNAEYADSLSQAQGRATALCPLALSEDLRTLILPWDLDDSFRVSCD